VDDDGDVFCPNCCYNLRGLSGAAIRCPECGAEHDAAQLRGASPESRAARRESLQHALDVACGGLVLAPVVACLGLMSPLVLRIVSFILALMIIAFTSVPAALLLRRLCGPLGVWRAALFRYLAAVSLMAMLVLAAPVVAVLLWWRALRWFESFGAAQFVAAGLLAAVLFAGYLYVLRNVDRMRRERDRRLDAILRLARADLPLGPGPGQNARRGE